MTTAYAEITELMQRYFDGFYNGDVDLLKTVFHPSCHLLSARDGSLTDDDMEAVYKRVAGRAAPSANGEVNRDRILSIDLANPEIALAKVQIAIGQKLFTDYLNCIKIDGDWKIISKVFTYDVLEQGAVSAQAAE
ncbi:MAG: nuclear transport factor 2 family protein [Alphaproteobacteria bacterium]|nr:nuclear transport factor 2 family protein [Alphaproteobacteria bacterium]